MNTSKGSAQRWLARSSCLSILVGILVALGSVTTARAQALGWEGETGVFVTPLAYTASVGEGPTAHPVVAYHYFNAGPVIGDFHEISIEVGLGKRFELSYTHEFHFFGDNPNLSPLWQNGFEIFNEAAQQPHHPYGFPTLCIPTTLTYCARLVPSPKYHVNFEVAVAQVAGVVMPGVDLKARHQVGAQVSYGF